MLTEKKSLNENPNLNDFLTSLEKWKYIPDYEHLGYTLNSLCNILKTTLLSRTETPEFTECNDYDLYNLIAILQSLLPNDELELLDLLNKE